MTDWNLFGDGAGPSTPAAYNGPFVAGTGIAVKGGGVQKWLKGYRLWVCPDAGADGPQPAGPQPFALWSVTGTGVGTLVSAGSVTSGNLTPGQWNDVLLSAPVPLAPTYDPADSTHGGMYIVACGIDGPFPSLAEFGASEIHAAGIVSGPLAGYSDTGGSLPAPYGMPQGLFATGGTDPAAVMPGGGSGSDSFFVDAIVTDTPPPGYKGSFRFWPNMKAANAFTGLDSAVKYTIALVVQLTQPSLLNRVWNVSPPGAASLPTRASVWSAASQSEVAVNASPSWSGAAGSGDVYAGMPDIILQPGWYEVSVYNAAGDIGQWGSVDNFTDYWGAGAGGSGITAGPLYAPPIASAPLAYNYSATTPGSTPAYTDGTRRPGQSVFGQSLSGVTVFPQLVAAGIGGASQNYGVDIEVTPLSSSGLLMAGII